MGGLELMGPYPESYQQIIPREHTPEDKMLVAREMINAFMTRAFRRPSDAAEVDRVLKLVELADAEGENFGNAIALGIQAMLVSPHFLFRVELDPPGDDAQADPRSSTTTNWPRGCRTSSGARCPTRNCSPWPAPASCAKATISIARCAACWPIPRSQALVENFAGQWLQLRNLKTAMPDKGVYPEFDDALRAPLQTESEMFFAHILREDRSVLEFLDADYTFVNERLARHYGIPDVKGDEFRQVSIDRQHRGGVLGQASVLTVTSNPTRTSPVKRGKWVMENLLGTSPPPPPADVPPLEEDGKAALTGSLRQRMEQHRSNAVCASCHKAMDPLGFGLENYDGIGGWRDKDGAFDIDPSGELPSGQKFAGPRDLKGVLAARQDEFLRCLAEKMLTYGLGRGVEYSDRCTVEDIARGGCPKRLQVFESDPGRRA